jgi:putative inorganic carbon (HCO3(-)) transporter
MPEEQALVGISVNSSQKAETFEVAAVPSPRAREPKWDLAFLGVLAYLVIEYTRLPFMFPWMQSFDVGKIAVGISVLGLLLARKSGRIKGSKARGIDAVLVLFLLASFLSALGADHQSPAWKQMITTAESLVIYYLISRIVSNSWRTQIFVLVLILLNLKLAQFAIRGYITFRDAGYSFEYLSTAGVGAGSGFFGNAGDLGVAMCVIWALTAPLIFGESKTWRRLFLLVCFAAFTGAVIVCGSRGALLGVGIVAIFSWLRSSKRIMGVVLVLVVILAAVFLAPEAYRDRLRSSLHPEEDPTASMRLTLWKSGMRMFLDHPLLGVGPGNFASEFASQYDVSTRVSGMWAPHSIYVQSLSELGLLGTLPLIVLWYLFFRVNAKTREDLQSLGEDAKRRFEYRLSQGLDLAMVGFLTSGAFLTVLYYPHLWVLLGLSAGLHIASRRQLILNTPTEDMERSENMPVWVGGRVG